jgi:hypothetical protein
MKRTWGWTFVAFLALSLALGSGALAQNEMARVRAVHASPDALALDV